MVIIRHRPVTYARTSKYLLVLGSPTLANVFLRNIVIQLQTKMLFLESKDCVSTRPDKPCLTV